MIRRKHSENVQVQNLKVGTTHLKMIKIKTLREIKFGDAIKSKQPREKMTKKFNKC